MVIVIAAFSALLLAGVLWIKATKTAQRKRAQSADDQSGETGAAGIDWFRIVFDDEAIHLDVRPPVGESWTEAIRWERITRVCFRAEGPLTSDGIYLFVQGREASYAIPTEGVGGLELWYEIIHRKLFDAELAIRAATSESGLFCWPEDD